MKTTFHLKTRHLPKIVFLPVHVILRNVLVRCGVDEDARRENIVEYARREVVVEDARRKGVVADVRREVEVELRDLRDLRGLGFES